MSELETDALEEGISFRRFADSRVIESVRGNYRLCITNREFANRTNYIYTITKTNGELVVMDSGHEPYPKHESLINYMNEKLDVKKFWE